MVHFSLAPEMVENSIAESAALAKMLSFWFGVVVPIPNLLLVSSKKKLALSCASTPAAPAKSIDP